MLRVQKVPFKASPLDIISVPGVEWGGGTKKKNKKKHKKKKKKKKKKKNYSSHGFNTHK